MRNTVLSLTIPLLVLFCAKTSLGENEKFFAIRHVNEDREDLILASNNGSFINEGFKGLDTQLWTKEAADSDSKTFYIINKSTKKAIQADDIDGGNVSLEPKSNNVNQKWRINSDNTISTAGNRALDLSRTQFGSNKMMVSPRTANIYQRFDIVYDYENIIES